MKILIVGGVAGGASAAARLRRLDENAEIIMFERDEFISFANCGLPYYIGGEITNKSALTLQTPQSFNKRFNVDVRNFNEVTAINKDNKTVTVYNKKSGEEYTESYDKLILSMGAKPIKPNIRGIDSDKVFTIRNIPDTFAIKEYIEKNKPQKALIVGGGYIGVEMAENLSAAGLDVTIAELSDHIIAPLDFDMAADVHRYIKSKGVNLILNNAVTAINDLGSELEVNFNNGSIKTDMIIMCVGVTPDTKIAKDAGININDKNAIIVNKNMLTNDENIYAVGDAIEVVDFNTNKPAFIPLAGPANRQARIAADNICGINSQYEGTQGSAILKVFDMTVAVTGMNERTALSLGINYDKVFTYSASHATYYPGANFISIKTIFEKDTGKILGAQLVGFDGVDKRCDILATVIRMGGKASDLTKLELCYAPPFGSAKDPVNMAGFVIENTLNGIIKNFHWHDVQSLPHDGSVTLLDVRTPMEVANGKIDGFMNIPLDNLRDNLDKIDKNKPVYVHCQIGLRSYIAYRILTGHGFDCYNLSGGYRLYETVINEKNQ